MTTEKYIQARAANASKEKYKVVLAKVPAVAPDARDAL
jgi:hypothetical protein